MKGSKMGKRNIAAADSEIAEIMRSRKSFVIYHDKLEVIKFMTDHEIAAFMRAIYTDRVEHKEPNIESEPRIVQMAFSQIKATFDTLDEKYIKTTITNRENGKKGGRPKKPSGLCSVNNKTELNPQKADTDTDTGTDTGTDKKRRKGPQKKDKFKNFNPREYSTEEYVDMEKIMSNM